MDLTDRADPNQHLLPLLAADGRCAVVGYSRDGRITLWGADAERLFGYRAESALGAQAAVLHENDDQLLALLNDKRLAGGPIHAAELMALTRTRDELPVSMTLLAAADGSVLALYRDLSAEHALREELRLARESAGDRGRQTEREAEFLRELLRHTVETIRIGLAVQETNSGMIAFTNEAFEAITGYSKLQVLGNTFDCLLSEFPETRARIIPCLERIVKAGITGPAPAAGMWELDFPAGRKHVMVYGRAVGIEGHPGRYALLIIEDQTDRQRLQTQLVQSEKLAAIGQLAAGIAHEIRNPLNTIFNALFDLNEIVDRANADVAEDVDVAMEEIRRVQEIITNLLDFARESGRYAGRASLNEVVRQTVRLVQHDLDGRGIDLVVETGNCGDVALDTNALKQVLINLITNASHAMPEGGRLSITTGQSDGTARLSVQDTGTGIAPEVLPDIFNPFFTTKSPGMGTGLGLSVVHSLISGAGGRIDVASTPGEGTTFTIKLPLAEE